MFALLPLIAVLSPANAGRTRAGTGIHWTTQTFRRKLPGCDSHPVRDCASVDLSYPKVMTAPTAKGKAEISSAMEDMLLTPLEKGKAPATTEEFASAILAHYQKWLHEGGDPRISWIVERKIDVDYSAAGVFCVRLLERVEQGKERAAKNTVYFNFRPEDGTLIQLSELIAPENMARFKEIAARHFHDKDQHVPAGEDARKPGEEFSLPRNFAIERDGLRFRYEEDQINPHSIRTPEFVVPYSEFRDLLRPGVKLP